MLCIAVCYTPTVAYSQYLTVNGPVNTDDTAVLTLHNVHLNVEEDAGMPGTGSWKFSGSQPALIFNAKLTEATIPSLLMYNSQGIQLMDRDLRITEQVEFGLGIIHTGAQRLILSSGTTTTGARVLSHVDGVVVKEGNTPFEFPIGANGHYQPLALVDMSGGESSFEARYVDDTHPNPQGPWQNGDNWPVSTCDYWELQRIEGDATAQVQLSWSNSPCSEVNDPQYMRVARYASDEWGLLPSESNGSVNQTVITDGQEEEFGSFALASIGGGINVLPIELLDFEAHHQPDYGVKCSWRTASETNNDFFTLARSADGQHWEVLEHISGAGNSSTTMHYSYTDVAPLPGTAYYRLTQTDYDGRLETFEPVAVHLPAQAGGLHLHKAYRQGGELRLHIQAPDGPIRAEVYDLLGKLLQRTQIHAQDAALPLPGGLPQGVYIMRLEQGGEAVAGKFFW